MKYTRLLSLLALTGLMCWATESHAQCEQTVAQCSKYLTDEYISDGQIYRALIYGDQTAEFTATLYGGAQYRIAALTGTEAGNLIFSVFDSENHLLFTNKDYKNAPYWDFKVASTLDCTIEAHLDQTKQSSGCAVLLIGFEK